MEYWQLKLFYFSLHIFPVEEVAQPNEIYMPIFNAVYMTSIIKMKIIMRSWNKKFLYMMAIIDNLVPKNIEIT